MTTDELITALQPYDLDMRWIASSAVWMVTLPDWRFLQVTAPKYRDALQQAYDQLQEEKAAE